MLGLMYLGTALLYFAVMWIVIRWAWRVGRNNGGSLLRSFSFAFAGFLMVYLPLFWNHIPVTLKHRSLCATDGGFNLYKTPEQWVAENRDHIAALNGIDLNKMSKSRKVGDGYDRYEYFGGLLASESRHTRSRVFQVDVLRVESLEVDVRTGAVVASLVDYQIGSRDDVRLWFAGKSCFAPNDARNPFTLSVKFNQQLRELAK